MLRTPLWPHLSFNMCSDSFHTWLSFHSAVLSDFPRRRQACLVVCSARTFESTSSHRAPMSSSQLEVVWLTMCAATCAGVGPAVLHGEMERVPIVFDAIHNPGRRGEGEETGVSVTVELFQWSSEPRDDPRMWHESCRWQTPMWVQTSREEPSLEGLGDTWAWWTRPYWYLERTRWLRDILYIKMVEAGR